MNYVKSLSAFNLLVLLKFCEQFPNFGNSEKLGILKLPQKRRWSGHKDKVQDAARLKNNFPEAL
jgi:hypothetical protein